MEKLDYNTVHHLAVENNGMLTFTIYDQYLRWIFNNELYMNILRGSFVWVVLIIIPASIYAFYRMYWWTLSANIWTPNVNQ